jgi:hypothetical protein
MALWVAHSIRLVGGSPVILGGLSQIGLPQGVQVGADPMAGSPYARIVQLQSKRPMVSFTSRNIAQILGLTGSTSVTIKTGGTYTALEVILAALDDCGRMAAGSVHRKIAFSLGCLVPRVLSVSAGQDAEITCEFMATTIDGVTSPMSIAGSQALPTLPAEARYTVGPVTLEDIVIDRIQQMSLDFGNTITAQQLDTGLYPREISVESQVPRFTATALAPEKLDSAAIPDQGLQITHANTEIFLRQRDGETSAIFGDTETEHIKLTMDGLAAVDEISASQFQPASLSLSVTGEYDGTNAPVVVAVDQYITEPA